MAVREAIGGQNRVVSQRFSLRYQTNIDRYPDRKQVKDFNYR